ncbi:ISA3 [Symbiodinium sp. CCMP2592]|nr:ISA3 [Symbiodinium sp. CCMP2592]
MAANGIMVEDDQAMSSSSDVLVLAPPGELEDFAGMFFRKYAKRGLLPAEKLGDAMRLLCMNPTAEEVSRHLLKCGKKVMLEQATFCQLLQD